MTNNQSPTSNLEYFSEKTKNDQAINDSMSLMEKMNNFLLKFSRVPLKEKLFFVQHLGIMLKAGISLSAALKTLAKQSENKYFLKILNEVSLRVEKGLSFTESLKPYEKIFGELFINMIEAGEISGKLEEVLKQLYIQIKKQNELMSKVKGALTYPLVILFAMGGIGMFVMIVVIPQLVDMLKSFNTELPLPTRILIAVSSFIAENGLLSALMGIGFISGLVYILRTRIGKYYFQLLLLKTPLFSGIIKKINLARFTRTMSSLLKTDIMIIKVFKITSNVIGNLHYRQAIVDMGEKIKKGGQINQVITQYPKLFPPMVNQMIAVGEETGELDNMLVELAEFYEAEVDQIMSNLPSVIEPLLILILGSAVGAMAVAVIMPMYSVTSGL
jgi:type II secretory pathway component PulF